MIDILIELRQATQRFIEAVERTARERELAPIVSELEKQISRAFREQGRIFLEGFANLKPFFPKPEELQEADYTGWWFDYADWWPYFELAMSRTSMAFIDPMDRAAYSAFVIGGYSLIGEIGIPLTFNLANPRATAFLRNYGARGITQINETTRQTIHDILVRGSEQGWSYDKTAKAISTRFTEFAVGRPQEHIRSRAHLVAVTETSNAYEQGNFEASLQLQEHGIEQEKMWVNVGDDRVSDGCLANTAVGWIPITFAFPSYHMRPPRFPGCRCHAQYRRMKLRT
jgi:hypothetical protein